MSSFKKRSQTRLFTAIGLIIGSFLSALALSTVANQREPMWSARTTLIPGQKIVHSDLTLQNVAIAESGKIYLPSRTPLVGAIMLRRVGAGELIPAAAITGDEAALAKAALPLSVRASDIPSDIAAGELVNIYHVGDPRLPQGGIAPKILLSHVYILGIDRKSQNLGGDLSLTLSVKTAGVLDILAATATGRLVAVRVYG